MKSPFGRIVVSRLLNLNIRSSDLSTWTHSLCIHTNNRLLHPTTTFTLESSIHSYTPTSYYPTCFRAHNHLLFCFPSVSLHVGEMVQAKPIEKAPNIGLLFNRIFPIYIILGFSRTLPFFFFFSLSVFHFIPLHVDGLVQAILTPRKCTKDRQAETVSLSAVSHRRWLDYSLASISPPFILG